MKTKTLWGIAFSLLLVFSLSGKSEPDFLIIGVTKCGTTSLYWWMTEHPKVYARKKKELHFFDSPRNYKKGLGWYQRNFSARLISGDATPGYFWKDECLERITRYCRNSKFILICRDPVKRVISEYFRLKRRGAEKLPFEKAVVQRNRFRRYLGAGMYAKHLERWLKFFPKKQFHIMFLEELAVRPEQELNKVFKFLGLSEYRLESYKHASSPKYDISEIKPETIQFLKNFYKPHNEAFARMIGRKLPWV